MRPDLIACALERERIFLLIVLRKILQKKHQEQNCVTACKVIKFFYSNCGENKWTDVSTPVTTARK